MKKLTLACISAFLFSGIGYAVENCCGLYSPGNDFKCGPHDNNPNKNGNCTWYARYKRPEVDGICTGKALLWFDQAKNGNLAVGPTPVAGSIAVFNSWMTIDGVYQNVGHVAYVESVNADGSFNVSEMGWNTWDCVHYYTRTKTSSGSLDGLIGFIYPVGRYSDSLDGFHADGTSQAFIDAFNRNYNKIGWPANNTGGGVYVHSWANQTYPSYSVLIQDFQGDMSSAHFGTDGQSAIMLSDYLLPKKAFLIKEGMWGYYKTHNGQYELGAPFTEEITGLRYATNKQPYRAGDAVKAGDTITVQKFYRVYGNQRKTLVYNNSRGGNVVNFPVGEFSIGNGVCPNVGQIYIYVDSDPRHDIPWPLLGILTPTGKWFTKPGEYIFLRHNSDGTRYQGWGLSAVINEGNEQTVGLTITTPANLTATAETPNSIRLVFTLPAGLAGYNIRVYQNNQKIADVPAAESYLVNGLSASVNYCFRVSAVDNVSGVESARSGEACATTPPSYTFVRTTFCKNVNPNSPYDPINETTVFYNSNGLVYSWVDLGNVYGVHCVKWQWFDPIGNLVFEGFSIDYNPYYMARLYDGRCKAWCALEIAYKRKYGIWRVKTYVDDSLVANNSFSLAISSNGQSYMVSRTTTCKSVDPNSPYNPVNEATVFYNSNNVVYSWVELGNVYGVHNIKWQWADQGGNLVGESSINTPDPFSQRQSYWEWYKAWSGLNIAAINKYGFWRVKTYVDDSLVANDSFSLLAIGDRPSLRFIQMITCKDANTTRPPLGVPVNETTVFYNGNNFVYSWILLGNVHGVSRIKWRWFDPSGNLADQSFQNICGPLQGFYWSWGWFNIATNCNYGAWRVGTYIDDSLVAYDSFSLAP